MEGEVPATGLEEGTAADAAVTAATRAVLTALAALFPRDRRMPLLPDTPGYTDGLRDIECAESTAVFAQLRSRYSRNSHAGKSLLLVLIQAVRWADELATPPGGPGCDTGDGPCSLAFAALLATLMRRLVVDGPQVAARAVTRCRAAILASTPPAIPHPSHPST